MGVPAPGSVHQILNAQEGSMAIVIKKRAQATAPAPVVEPDEVAPARREDPGRPKVWGDLPVAETLDELWAAPAGTLRAKEPTVCSYCGHLYGYPCHGKAADCMNAAFVRERDKATA